MRWRINFSERRKYRIHLGLPDIDQHVGVGELLQRTCLCPLVRRNQAIKYVATVVVLEHLFIRHRRYPIIVEFEPPAILLRLDQSKVMTAVQITRVHEDAVKLVDARLRPILFFVQELREIYREGEFMAIVDLEQYVRNQISRRKMDD